MSRSLKRAAFDLCWDKNRGLLADTPEKKSFSQHANINAVLADVFSPVQAKEVMIRALADKELVQCSLYFRFYLHQAMKKAGLADRYMSMLDPWKSMIEAGLSTFAEVPDTARTRSDCHAWSASPNYDLTATVLGIVPGSHGFRKVRIEPRLGELNFAEGAVPHPRGMIRVEFRKTGGQFKGKVLLPEGLSGVFVYNKTMRPLRSGNNSIAVRI
jgi:hypothetical protein